MSERTVPAEHFCNTLAVNVDNTGLTDAEFRQFVRNTLPIVILNPPAPKLKSAEEAATDILKMAEKRPGFLIS